MNVSRIGALGAVLVAPALLAASAPARSQPAVGRCPTVVSVPVQPYYVPVAQALPPVSAQQPWVYVSGYQPTVIILMPQSQPAPSPFGPRYDEDGRLVAISTPQFIGAPSSSFLNSSYRFDETGRLIGISTPQTLEPLGPTYSQPLMLGRPFGASSFFGTSSFGGTFRGGLRLHSFGD